MSHENVDYEKLGLKVGLEIHQQLATKGKLFCPCPAELTEEDSDEFERRLRPTRGEAGDVDIAALFEWRKGRSYLYEAPHHHSCLVEADEEPPHEINDEALIITMAVAKALNSHIVDEVHVMRKIVIDGSNTTGFQRTAVIALGGKIDVDGKEVPIETICLEEDASRKIREEGLRIRYRLDRLGIPLIEIATAPVIKTPEEAAKVALAIGKTLRLTGKVRRGLGTIRQDLNVSIIGGAKTEIKGVQRLDLIPKVIHYEVIRQKTLLEVRDELVKRGAREEDYNVEPVDVTDVFSGTSSKIIKKVISKGGRVYAVKLSYFHGLLGKEVMPGRRVGTEFADYVRFWSGVGGIFHSDELPKYGITQEELDKVFEKTGAIKDRDAVVIVAADEEKARKAIETILYRAKLALKGVPEETRGANEDGTTRFLRPRPGSARMYPETDLPPKPVTEHHHREAEKLKPEPLSIKRKRLIEEYGISPDLADEVLNDVRLDLIEGLIAKYKEKVKPSLIASFFINTLRGLRGEGVDIDAIPEYFYEKLIELLAEGRIAKEALEELVKKAYEKGFYDAERLAEELGLTTLSREEAEKIINKIIEENIEVIRQRGMKAMGLLMGRAMAKLRGRIDGKIVSEIVKTKLLEVLEKSDK
ncbi:MAG: Glu-tRNA(Gln) amidotransferase subunit GatE [Desulfurococcales archaeon]|nr:Glu-tRNA(Gln) amidotransferase subunit GatE [Desulfurococcales archaeon]